MVYTVLSTIQKKLDEFIRNKFSLNEQLVQLSNLANGDSLQENISNNKLLVTLVNIEREYSMGIQFRTNTLNNGTSSLGRPPVHLNFFVMFSANFAEKNYDESLKYISATLEFVQRNDLINQYNTPELDKSIAKLQIELVNLSFHELSNLWSILGSKYLPSFLCKIRMIAIDSDEIDRIQIASETVSLNE